MHRRHIQGQGAQHQGVGDAGNGHEVPRQHGEQVRAGHHPPRSEKLVDGEHHTPHAPQRCKGLVDEAKRAPGKAHQHVAGRAKLVQRQRRVGQRMALAHHAHIFAVVDAPAVKGDHAPRLGPRRQVGQHGRKVAHGHVGGFFLKQTAGIAGGEWNHPHGNAGGLALHHLHQPGHQRGRGGVRHGQHKSGCGSGGLKQAGRQRLLQLRQGFAYRGPQCQGPLGGLHAVTAAHHQVVTQHFAQSPQRVAHCWLRERQLVRSPRQAALCHHLVKDAQQVQVKGAEINRDHAVKVSLT